MDLKSKLSTGLLRGGVAGPLSRKRLLKKLFLFVPFPKNNSADKMSQIFWSYRNACHSPSNADLEGRKPVQDLPFRTFGKLYTQWKFWYLLKSPNVLSQRIFVLFLWSFEEKFTRGTPEARSDKSLTLLTFDIWYLTFIIRHSTFIQHLLSSIALILFKRLRVTLVTSIASNDWLKIWQSSCWIYTTTSSP